MSSHTLAQYILDEISLTHHKDYLFRDKVNNSPKSNGSLSLVFFGTNHFFLLLIESVDKLIPLIKPVKYLFHFVLIPLYIDLIYEFQECYANVIPHLIIPFL